MRCQGNTHDHVVRDRRPGRRHRALVARQRDNRFLTTMTWGTLTIAVGLIAQIYAVYALMVNAGLWQDLVEHESRAARWLFEPSRAFSSPIGLTCLLLGAVMQVTGVFLD
jgi:hypothetical protein